jgi:hypothetical protein
VLLALPSFSLSQAKMKRFALSAHGGVLTAIQRLGQRQLSEYSDGTDGFDWKQRYLQERRDTALEFLGDVKKRVPIHDAIRQRASINRKVTDDIHFPTLFDDILNKKADIGDEGSSSDLIDSVLDEILQDENAIDRLQHVKFGDLPLLENEFLDHSESDEATLRNWLKLKRDTADYRSYASIPESERTTWSAWYLRHVKGKEDN